MKLGKMRKSIDKIKNDEKIKVLLTFVLAIGNYMNGESARGGAYGFRLDVVEKIMDVKNIEGKKSLLVFIIEIIEKQTGKIT